MALSDHEFPMSVTTGYDNPVDTLFVPMLKRSATFDVAVGYFTSGWLKDTAEGMAEFAVKDGRSRWIVSPELNPEDLLSMKEAMEKGETTRYAEKKIEQVIAQLQENTREELCALIAAGVLEFRIAIPKRGPGLFHAKFAIATDFSGAKVGCSGSYNFTSAAKSNWEHIDIFKSWHGDGGERIALLEDRFSALWDSCDPNYLALTPSEELLDRIRVAAGSLRYKYRDNVDKEETEQKSVKLRDYQLKAIEAWGNNKGRGTYVMATGSGKTVTALATIQRLEGLIVTRQNGVLVTVIVVPLKHLLDQWYEESKAFGLSPVKCYENSSLWTSNLASKLGAISSIGTGHLVALVTNATLISDNFQRFLDSITDNFLFVADEAHNLGAASYLAALPDNATFRLALSATPQRYNDDFGTDALFDYFGKPVIEFALSDAINAGFLCKYVYIPSLCALSDAEYVEYLELSELIQEESKKSKEKGEKTKEHDRLLGKRADLISGVESKLHTLETQLKEQRSRGEVTHTLVYCGSRKGEDERRHIERTVHMIGSKLDIRVRKFTAAESMDDRRQMLKLFSTGELGLIAAIKCLDEGVDVPATRTAYVLASTTNPREYIQRRGRVLRKYPGKEFAIIYDYLVTPPSGSSVESDLVARELERAWEFAELATNKAECTYLLDSLANEYRIDL
tara:strand:+ start:1797 stop:3836 length:2040 start_codon:yes stop_codon:yes gene_type:complete